MVRPVHAFVLPPRALLLLAVLLLAGSGARAAGALRLEVQPSRAKPGDPVLVRVHGGREPPTGTLGERPLPFVSVRGGFLALTGIPVEQPPGSLTVRVVGAAEPPGQPPLEAALEVVDPRYPEAELRVAGQYVEPPPQVQQRIEEDRLAIARAFSQPLVPPLFRTPFVWPRKARITAPYGDLRTYNGVKKSQHYGTDLDGRVGAPVQAANAGQVVLARDCYASGQTVLVHHGAGLYTAYFHLSRMLVKEGARLRAGQRLGLVGKTGRVTGPHLHWGVRADGLWVDGETLLRLRFTSAGRP